MEKFRMVDVIPLIGLPYPSPGKTSYNVKCPCCDEDPRGKHLNINLQKNVFRCPRCGVSGGIFALYSLYTGISVDKAREAIAEKLSIYGYTPQKTYIQPQVPEVREYPITDVETRNATYTALLSKLSLAPDHRTNLLNRGLIEDDIQKLGYKSTPVAGMSAIAKQLMSEGHYLAGVPGFYRTENDQWTFIHENRGILIPMRDLSGNIQGLQIRRDNTEKRKFRWVSSAERKDGCKAEGWTHIVGAVKPCAILTEGPMKADVIHTLTGRTVIAVPGVNTLAHLKVALEKMREQGLTTIKTAFDMDMLTNPHVQNGYRSLLLLLDEMGLKFGTYLWDSRYKGLDDYIWEYIMNRERKQ